MPKRAKKVSKKLNVVATAGKIVSWVLSVFLLFVAIANILTIANPNDLVSGFMLLLAGLVIFPPVNDFFRKRYNAALNVWLKIILVLALVVIASYIKGA